MFYAVSFLLAASLVGCSNEESESLAASGSFTVEAGFAAQSRTALSNDDNSTVTWSKGDQIYLFGGKSSATLTLKEGDEGKTSGTFSGSVNGFASQLEYALYPVPTVDGDKYTFEFPATISYSENSNAPMYGTLGEDKSVSFSNLSALVRIPLTNLDTTKDNVLTLTMTGIAGTATVNMESEVWSLSFPETGMTNEVTVTIPASVKDCNVDIPVPARTYSGYTVKLNGNVIAQSEEEKNLSTSNAALVSVGSVSTEEELEPEDDGNYVISTTAELIQFAAMVNGGETFSGKTVKLGADIDLAGINWTPIGDCNSGKYFKGTFDGQNNTISNLFVDNSADEDENSTSGLFGWIDAAGATIQNVKVDNATVKGSHWTGVIAGYATGTISGCTVSNSTVIGYYVNDDADGDKIGGIVGFMNEDSYLNGNTVTDCTITGNRDLGGIAGGVAASTKEMKNNVVKSVTLTYTTNKDYASAGKFVSGRTGYTPDNTNTAENVTIICNAETAEAVADLLTSDAENIKVVLVNDADVTISSLGTITGGSGEYKLGGESTENITIDLNGKTLNITTTYWSSIGAKNDDATITIKNGTMTSSQATGTWNSYDVTFANCNYVIENVTFDKAVAFTNADKSVVMNGITINETHDYYALWISARGQNIEINDLTIDSAGRGIKIDEEYVDNPAKVTLKLSKATFKTAKKAAIMVKSAAGADITLSDVNISNVAADTSNAVWVDEKSSAYADLVTVTGGTVITEK